MYNMILIVFMIINSVVADEEVQYEGDLGGGEDAAVVVVNILNTVEGVPASIFGAVGGLKQNCKWDMH